MNNQIFRSSYSRSVVAFAVAALTPIFGGVQTAYATATNIASVPIFATTATSAEVKPNVMMVLDDSGSMDWDYMPDDASNFSGKYGFASSQCNGIFYNPAITYSPPVNAAGTSYANSTFTSAAKDGFGLTTGSTNLSSSFKANSNDTSQAAYYYKYSGLQTTEKLKDYYDTNSSFYKECNASIGGTTKVNNVLVSSLFTKVTVSSTSGPGATDERTNFANWYTYYRTRMQMMKTATGQAFKALDNHFRVGFMTLNNNASPAFLNITDFDSTQKTNFYAKLYASDTGSSTPLREGLANAGRIYAGKLTSINASTVVNPVQYSCQQNFTILSTDGFWNGTDSAVKKLDGSTMDNQDGSLARPYNDGSSVQTTIVTPYTSTQNRQSVSTVATKTNVWTQSTTVIGAACTTATTASSSIVVSTGNNNTTAALGLQKNNPDDNSHNTGCYDLTSGSSNSNGWFCIGSGTGNSKLSVSNTSITDSKSVTWYLVSSGANGAGCVSANTAFGSGYSTTAGVCPASAVISGKLVTITPYTQTETISNAATTTVDIYTATQTTTQVITNGVAGSVGALSPSTPVYSLTSNISSTPTAGTDTCGGQAAPCPSSAGTWTAGTPTTNNVCTATAQLPTAGTTTPVITSSTASNPVNNVTVQSSTGPTAGTPTITSVSSGGVANTLADTAAYYYNTNLRTTALGNCTGPIIAPATTPTDLCVPNTVPKNGVDTATWQHMTTFTLGLGARGRMVFSPSYLTDTSGDYYDVSKGNTVGTTNCTWRDALTIAGGKCNWPVPGADQIENIDDLWHAAVNGHGNYFSASNPADLATGLNSALNVIINTPQPGTAAAAATSNPKVTSTSNFQFVTYFKTVEWSGELIRQTISLTDGSVPTYNPQNPDPATYDWSAQSLLDAKSYTTRNIYTKSGSSLIPFTWSNLVTAGLQSNFTAPNITTAPPAYPLAMTGLSQFCATGSNCIASSAQTNTTVATGGAAGEALVNFLRGDTSNQEGAITDATKFFRYRPHVLGDIVSAQPQYVGPPSRTYSDSGYDQFKTNNSSRTPLVYVAANDGMLHAFDPATGNEQWAYIPSFVLPRLYTLADKNYANLHQYFVEGTPVATDICPKAPATCAASDWKTILVGGLNGGGTGYYALDITNPASPALLWEFTDNNMGYTFGRPQVTKLDNGTWVVLLTSGYNNCPFAANVNQQNCVKNSVGDGKGYLYVLNAGTGAQIGSTPIATSSGSTTAPSGLAQIVAHADSSNVSKRAYGGDLNGNLWRFSLGTSGYSSNLLTTFVDALGNAQPITSRPQVSTVSGSPVVFVGTGRYLGTNDVGSTLQQSFYAVKDTLASSPSPLYSNPRLNSGFISQTATNGTCLAGTSVDICDTGESVRFVTQNGGSPGDSLTTKSGWFLDFPAGSGELDFTDSKLALGVLIFSTSVPRVSTTQACTSSTTGSDGNAISYQLAYMNGGAIGTTTGIIGTSLGTGIATAPLILQLPNGTVIAKYRLSSGQEVSDKIRVGTSGSPTQRVSWRELISP